MLSGSFGKKVGQLLRLRVLASMVHGEGRKSSPPAILIYFNPFCTCNHHVPPHTMTIHDVGPRPVLGALKIHENSMVRIQCILLRKTSHAYYFSMNSGKTKARKLTKSVQTGASSCCIGSLWCNHCPKVQCVGIDCPVNYDIWLLLGSIGG